MGGAGPAGALTLVLGRKCVATFACARPADPLAYPIIGRDHRHRPHGRHVHRPRRRAAQATDWSRCLHGPADRQAVFDRAAERSGVPASVLLGVSFMESRWDDHDGAPSTSAGYGPMHLTSPDGHRGGARTSTRWARATASSAATVQPAGDARADRQGRAEHARQGRRRSPASARSGCRTDAVANVCGGAAVLADYQREAGGARGPRRLVGRRRALQRGRRPGHRAAVRQAGLRDHPRRQGPHHQRRAAGRCCAPTRRPASTAPAVAQSGAAARRRESDADCPAGLGCEWLPAPYEHVRQTPATTATTTWPTGQETCDIDYIIIHDTEASWDTTLQLVNDPTYVSWQYSLRSVDGHIAQHVDNARRRLARRQLVRQHALDRSGARGLRGRRRRLVHRVDVPDLRRRWCATSPTSTTSRSTARHIIGHDQVPGHPARQRRRHALGPGAVLGLGALLRPARRADPPAAGDGTSTVVTVRPGFDDNQQLVTRCDDDARPRTSARRRARTSSTSTASPTWPRRWSPTSG